ncbi:MAG: hypothetical protein U5N86_09640 [Planctomycetota bacterium]|nr:hypothetical protein [Planctomycetota bacterium]
MRASGNEHVAEFEYAVLHEYGRERATLLVHLGLNDGASGVAFCHTPEFLHLGDEHNHFEQVFHAVASCGTDLAADCCTTPVLWNEVVVHQLLLYAHGVCFRLVNLVYGDGVPAPQRPWRG